MAVPAGFAPANPYSKSLIERIRLSRRTQWRRLLIWGAVVAGLSVAAGLGIGDYVPAKGVEAAVATFAGVTAFAACVYCLAVFALERSLRALFAATAFSTLGAGAVLGAVADLGGRGLRTYDWIGLSAQLLAALLFAGQAHACTKWRSANRLQSVGQLLLAAVAVSAYPLLVSPCALNTGLLPVLGGFAYSAEFSNLARTTLVVVSIVLIVHALILSHRRYMTQADGLSGLVCYFYVSMAIGLLFQLGSSERFDRWYTMCQVAMGTSWLVLAVGSGIENAFSHKEADCRLEELETLHDVSWSLVGAGTLTELLNLFVSTLVNKLGARIAAVYLDAGGSSLELAAICGSDEAKPGTRYPLVATGPYPGFHSGHTARAFVSREIQVANDVFVDVELVPWRIVAADDGCAASIPLADHDVCIGVLDVYFSDASQLTTSRLRLLATIAAAATSAIEYALSKQAGESYGIAARDLAA